MTQVVPQTLLAHPEEILLRSANAIADFGSTLIVAPHPDDESLGCGGAIALLQRLGISVEVLVMSDGTQSHPNSRRYPAAALRDLRESETRTALALLGVSAVTFFRLKDGAVPHKNSSDFDVSVTRLRNYLSSRDVQTIFLPWRYDPHLDHRATWDLLTAAIHTANLSVRQIEYLIWDWDPLQRGDAKLPPVNVEPWRLDISTVIDLKQQAIAAYRSQTTDLIDDDPAGFRLTPEMLANFVHPWELYLEQT
jgi:LmbE family N-acetylglucosaminyl deacetylase